VGVHRKPRNNFIAGRNGKPQRSPQAFDYTVHEIEHQDVVISGTFAEEFVDKHPCEWTKQAFLTLEEAMKVYMVEVIAEFHC